MNKDWGEIKRADHVFYSEDKSKLATVTKKIIYRVKCYNNNEIINSSFYHTEELAESMAEDYVLEKGTPT